MFLDASWLAVYFGQNIVPETFDPRAETLDLALSESRLQAYQSACKQAVLNVPSHSRFLADFIKAKAA
jgi:tryptophan 7-halogenase